MTTSPYPTPQFSPAKPKGQTSSSPRRHLLVVGTDSAVLSYLRNVFVKDGLQVMLLSPEQAIGKVQKGFAPDAVLLQVFGSATLQNVTTFREVLPTVPIIVFSCFHDSQLVVKAMKAGASDYFQLPFDLVGLRDSVRRFVSLVEGSEEHEAPNETALLNDNYFVCASPRMNEIRGQCAILARVDLPVLILGESGTGKEIIAQYIHKMSPRAHRTFLKVNCAAMPADLLESELFGYEQGAFTGAVKSKPGKFEICNMGTILLDEIGEMPPPLQSKLLQVLQDGTFSRLGGRTSIKVDVRVIAATNIDMNSAITAKTFREDLFYRLNGFSIHMPPLRERKEEIPVMIRHFMRKLSAKYARQPLTMSQELLQAYMEHDWPGNLRELENSVKRFLVLGDEKHVLAELRNARGNRSSIVVPQKTVSLDTVGGLKKLARSAMNEAETEAMGEALRRNNWNRKQAASELKISYKALLYKIRQYGLTPNQEPEQRAKAVGERQRL